MNKIIQQGWFAAIRKSPEHDDWIDIGAIGADRDHVMSKVKETDTKIPDWAKLHPVVRISRIIIKETE